MLTNIPINELIKVLSILQKEASLCTINIDYERRIVTFIAIKDPNAISNNLRIETPIDKDPELDMDDLDKLII